MPGGYLVRSDCLSRADEIKHPVAMQKHIDALDRLLQGQKLKSDVVICLQPISQRPRATELAMKTCIERNWRLSVQMHKYLNIESVNLRSGLLGWASLVFPFYTACSFFNLRNRYVSVSLRSTIEI